MVAFWGAILDVLPQPAAVLGDTGVVVAVNSHWAADGERIDLGTNFLDAMRESAANDPFARRLLDGIEAVVCGEKDSFSCEASDGDRDGRWASLEARALPGDFGGTLLIRGVAGPSGRSPERRAGAAGRGSPESPAELLSQRDELEWIYQNAPIGLCLLDLDLRYLRVNQRLAEMNGLPVEAHIGRSVFETVPALAARVKEIAHQLLETRKPVLNAEFAGETPAAPGVPRCWNTGWYPVLDKNGEIIGVGAVVEETTERKRAEQALRESEQQERRRSAELQALLDTAPIGLSIALDPQGLSIRGNRANEQIFGVAPGGELSKTAANAPAFQVLKGGRVLTAGEMPMQRAVRGEAVAGDVFDVRREDGELVSVFAKAMPLYDEGGNPRGAVGAFMDITKPKRAEDALRESEARFRSLVEAYAQAVWETDPEGVVVSDSPSWRAYTGQTLEEFLGWGWLGAVHPDDRAHAAREWRRAVASKSLFDTEYRLKIRDDGWRWTNVRGTPLLSPDGEVLKWTGMNIDVDARKRAEAALRDSEERQAFLLRLTDALRQIVNPHEIQAAACRLLGEHLGVNRVSYADIEGEEFIVREGYAQGVDPFMVRMPVADLGAKLIDSYRRGETVAIDDVFAEEGFTEAERERFKAGQITALASVILSKQGQWVGTLCAHNATPRAWRALDIELVREVAERIWSSAERARAVAALRESEFRLQLALNSGNIGIYEANLENMEMIWDDRLRMLWGLPAGAPIGYADFLRGVHPGDRERVARAIHRALDPTGQGNVFVECRVVGRADGVERWVAATGAVFFENGRAIRIVGTAQDITARKRAEAERQKFVSLAEQSLEFIGICDMDFVPLYVNPAGAALVGLERAQAPKVLVGDFFFEEDRPSVDAFFERVRRDGHANMEIRFRHFVTGEALWMLYNVFVLRDERDEPLGFATVSRDITQRRRVEDALRAADRRKDEFLATLAHELRNPLAPIRNAVHVLRHDAAATMKSARDLTLLAMVDRQVDHLIRLVDDLMEVSRITRGKIELRKQRVDLGEVLRHAIETAQPTIDQAHHRLHVAMPPEPVTVDGDPVRLAQVFTNLLNNAAKYTEHGGDIGLMVERRAGEAVVTVRDSGVGIPAEMAPRVFDLFTQVDRTLGRAQGGLGIGLALVKSLLELHGGAVEAQSEGLGRGSAFIVRLPTPPDVSREETMPATASNQTSANRRILVIDDDHDVADSLVMFLETFGATVQVAYSGAAGIEALVSFKPDLVFLDLGMPSMDGYETARRIRALPEGAGVQLVALTGWGQEQVNDRARAAGFDRQLTKPAGFEALQELLGSL
ncbi:PAS domain S-box protein [Methylocystis parvus]|uniref:PAS domain S-box protein n=1 Tax=Methylocystis parvus TaxID=134 RepID=UPI003C790BD3